MKLIKKAVQYVLKIVSKIYCIVPINEKKIIFCNFVGRGYGDNPKYIAEYLINNYEGINMYWLCRDVNEKLPEQIKPLKIYGLKYYFHIMTAKIIVNNTRCPMRVFKRKNQVYLQTWHASFGPKKVEKEAEQTLTKQYIKEAKLDGKLCNAILSCCAQMSNQMKKSFWLNPNTEILEYGIPRNDFLINNCKDEIKKSLIKAKINVDDKAFIVLYAPTYRDDNSIKGYDLDFDLLHKTFKERFGREVKILLRFHPNAIEHSKEYEKKDYIINVSNYPDMQELLIISDFVITDYSSVGFDCIILKKPVLEITLDLEEYKKLGRLSEVYYTFPIPRVNSNEDAVKLIKYYDLNKFYNAIDEYTSKYPIFESGESAKKVSEWIIKKMNSKNV